MDSPLKQALTPQLRLLHRGKVRDSLRVDDKTRLIVVTDRISAFDQTLDSPIPHKGAVLNSLANFWFEQTRSIVPNHLIRQVASNASLVHEVEPLRVEVIVRGYLTGSMWRGYEKGQRTFSGVEVGDGMTRNQRFDVPLITPTTKEESDRPVSRQELLEMGLVDSVTWEKMEVAARALFAKGTELLAERGIILVDTKYEFGLLDGELMLIDELHTPDSSRFWQAEDWARDPASCVEHDKEFVRQYLLRNKTDEGYPTRLPDVVVHEASLRYRNLHEQVTGQPVSQHADLPRRRLANELAREGIIKPGFVAIVMGSKVDLPHVEKIRTIVEEAGIYVDVRVVSAHKNGEDLVQLARQYNASIEPGAVIAVAGRSNGLGGALAANLNLPVVSFPPFKDAVDMMVNINSSLLMPSHTPAATIVDPKNAAAFAMRCLNLPHLREYFSAQIAEVKDALRDADREVRGYE